MARNEGMEYGEAFGSAVASRQGRKKAMSGPKKPAKKKGNLKPGGSYTSGRAIPLGIPGAKKKPAMTGSKEKRVAGPSVGRSQRSNKGAQVRTRSMY